MSDLRIRRVRFDLAGDDIPFIWQPERPVFSVVTNYTSFLAPGFENMIVDATREAIPLMRDGAAIEEANLYLRQEAQHSSAHVRHIKALIRRYPGLQETIDELFASYRELTETRPLVWRLAYTAVLENTFTPYFRVWLDHEDKLFRPGDERVASLWLWHICEEIEHRSSAMIVYKAVEDRYRHRLRAIPSVVRHISRTTSIVRRGFEKHVPVEDGGRFAQLLPDGITYSTMRDARKAAKRLGLRRDQAMFAGVPHRELAAMFVGLIRSQGRNYDGSDEEVPRFAGRWFDRYDDEPASAARWYSVGMGRRG